MIRTPKMISSERISQTNCLEDLKCPICLNLLWDPIGCNYCKNYFCRGCISHWIETSPQKNCPKCKKIYQSIQPFPLLLSLLSNINITCKFKSHGCIQYLNYDNLEKHEHECLYQERLCEGCHKNILKKDYESHYQVCEKVSIPCEICKKSIKRADINAHNFEICFKEALNILSEKVVKLEISNQKLINLIAQMNIPQISIPVKLCGNSDSLEGFSTRKWTWTTSELKFKMPFQVTFEFTDLLDLHYGPRAEEIVAVGISRNKYEKMNSSEGRGTWWKDTGIYAYIVGTGNKFNKSIYNSDYGFTYSRSVINEKMIYMKINSSGSLSFGLVEEDFGEAFFGLNGDFYLFVAVEENRKVIIKSIDFSV